MPCAAHTNSLKTCQQGDKPCQRAICGNALHRIPADEEDTPVISSSEAMGWSVAVWIAVAVIFALFALMNLPIVAWIFA